MITSQQAFDHYGTPRSEASLTLWDVPTELEIGVIPKRIYCNRDLIFPLEHAFENLIKTGCVKELRTWDGCFNIRTKQGGMHLSLHSWGLAIDVNSSWNRVGAKPTLSVSLIKCFKDAGFDWGGDWGIPDGMHMQLARLPA